MKIKLIVFIAFIALTSTVNAQINVEDRIKKEKVVRGIIIQGDQATEGYIKKISETRYWDGKTYNAYDNFQSDIRFIPKDEFENTEKLKAKMFIKYKPDDIDGYKYFSENGDVLVYESVKYSDKEYLSFRMIPKKLFLRVESRGKMNIYSYYIPLPSAMAGSDEYFTQCYVDASTPIMVYRPANETKATAKSVEFINIEKELADCPKVVEKYKNGEYNVVGKKGSESKIVKLANKTNHNDEMKYSALKDYNTDICDQE